MTPAENIARAFGGEFRNGQGFVPTLGHSAKDRGTTVKDADGGDVVFASFNGGDWRELKDECRRRGLLPERDRADGGGGWRDVARFEYVGADGTVTYRTLRKEKPGERKRFVAQRPDGRGGWVNGLGDAERVLYRLPDILAADPATVVYLTEGERKADKLAGWGMVATAIAFGARGWRDSYAAALSGRTVIVLPDNDDEGRGFAEKAAASIRAAGGRIAIVELPGLPVKGDVIDWSGTADDLRALVAATLARGARPIAATPYLWRDPATIPPRPWVFGRWFLRGTATAVIAPGGIGKTTLLDTTALSLVTGRAVLGKSVWGGAKRVWLWNLEDDLEERSRSIQAAAKHHGVTPDDLAGRLFVDSAMDGSGLCTAVEDGAGFRLIVPVYEAITAELIARGIDVLIVDPFVSSHEVEENANSKIDKIAKAWGRVAKDASCSIVLVHHTSKAGAAEVTALSARGAVALVNACRSALVLNRMDDQEAERFAIEDDAERRRHFTVQDDKHNRAPAEKADWFRLASVDLGNGDSVGVVEPWSPPDPFDGLTGDHLYRVQLALVEGEHREDWQSPAWAGIVVANVLGLDPKAKADRARIRKVLSTWVEAGALRIAERDDEKRKPRKWVEVARWQNDTSTPPLNGGVERGGAHEAKVCSTTTPAPLGAVGWSKLPGVVEQRANDGGGATPSITGQWRENPALGRRDLSRVVFPAEPDIGDPSTTYTERGLGGPAPNSEWKDDGGGIVWGDADDGRGN